MATHISHSPPETEALGETWGRSAESGLVIALCGDLGAGKTQLVKGLARGLGITGRPHSPTFALVNIYSGGRLDLFHLDLYRLESRAQFVTAGLEEYLNPAGATVIEWAERWFGTLEGLKLEQHKNGPQSGLSKVQIHPPGRFRWVQIDTLTENQRRITYEDFGG
jgi:tRNA threonylcarbamoyladenosine biosynthesis protein TsaE